MNNSRCEISRQNSQKAGQTHRQYSVGKILSGEKGGDEGDAVYEEKRGAKDDANRLLDPHLRRVAGSQNLRTLVLRAPSRHHFVCVLVTNCVAVGIILAHRPLDDLLSIQMRHLIWKRSVAMAI